MDYCHCPAFLYQYYFEKTGTRKKYTKRMQSETIINYLCTTCDTQ